MQARPEVGQEEEHHDHDQDAAVPQGMVDILNRGLDEVRLPEDVPVDLHALGERCPGFRRATVRASCVRASVLAPGCFWMPRMTAGCLCRALTPLDGLADLHDAQVARRGSGRRPQRRPRRSRRCPQASARGPCPVTRYSCPPSTMKPAETFSLEARERLRDLLHGDAVGCAASRARART